MNVAIRGGVAAWAVAVAMGSCGGRTDLLLPGGEGTPDATASCGVAGAACCGGAGCNAGLTCSAGTCVATGTGYDAGLDARVESGACPAGGCDPGTSRACNGYGTQTCDARCDWGACSCPSPSACTPASTRCAGNGVATCDACGQWGAAAPCAAETPYCANGVCESPPSCQPGGPGMTTCGAGRDGDAGGATGSCCTSPVLPGGTFYRSYPPEANGSGDADPATVSGYRLDDTLVTVGRFRQFVNAVLPSGGGAGWVPPAGSGKHAHLNGGLGLANVGGAVADGGLGYEPGWSASDDADLSPTTGDLTTAADCADAPTWTDAPAGQENLPINCVNWWEAYAFCIWDGGFLPSEAEWEFAASGGSEQRAYPWGATDPGTGSAYAIYGCYYPADDGGLDCAQTAANIAPVGTASLGAGAFGQLDLVGNLWEWTLDWYAPFVTPCSDCADTAGSGARVIRGGDWDDISEPLVVPNREGWDAPSLRSRYYGFRCARSP